ncbi:TRAP transporter, 4TM/12TM fusion protein [Alloalcanivorax dieselolei B5]|uniref:TRAP transporter, 4TM/12TM fusion protein n=1 Tax=Alcanivorax dieselolei (strain DSM 16502 / CGMCC 1.3690 / MCCC 1A00001 / B-5) TaxID=930169 RepID=K0CHB1_ALCDB|nr:TRAP transporter permease [Alloalcanivorax dieselolei]AFT71132.1 TRAP transporter, 4TM/12TM fusion protein [Alloalcanivorax dieselolei B5]GGJ93315.1 ATP-binding protein [Alloalcanivorax dieselolei]
MTKALTFCVRMIALAITALQLYSVIWQPLPLHMHYVLFLGAVLLLVFGQQQDTVTRVKLATDVLWIVITISWVVYLTMNHDRYLTRIAFVDRPTLFDLVAGTALVVTLLEATRRVAGLGLFVIAATFIAYAFLGQYLPSGIGHSGLGLSRFIDIEVLSNNGVFGVPLGAVVSYIFYFILFATFLELSGGGQLFIDLAFALTGRSRGGPAKSAVISSGLMGSINGSAVANVVGTGTFTIPLMKRFGYKPHFSGAVEAASSTGGQLMPPIMGAAAFVMVELTGLNYVTILKGAALPALLYYLAILFAVDLTAKKEGLSGMSKADLPNIREGLLKRIHLLLPLAVLIGMMVSGASLMMSAIYAFVSSVLASLLTRETRIGLRKMFEGFIQAAKSIIVVAVPCATAGLIIGIIVQTGIGLKFTEFVLTLASGSMILSLIAVMFACIILGMGMPTVSAYIMVAILMAPALGEMGIYVLSAHLFIFYFALLSFVTPPVALASYAAAALAKADATRTGLTAFKLTLPGFIVPFAFVYNPALVMNGAWYEILLVALSSILGVYTMAGTAVGMHLRHSTRIERLTGFVGAILLITPNLITDLAGFVLVAGMLALQLRRPREAEVTSPPLQGALHHVE